MTEHLQGTATLTFPDGSTVTAQGEASGWAAYACEYAVTAVYGVWLNEDDDVPRDRGGDPVGLTVAVGDLGVRT